MSYILYLVGLVGPFFMIKYRERLGDLTGEAEWMRKVGGVYNLIVIVAVFLFFWTIAEMTGTTTILFKPLISIIPGLGGGSAPAPEF